MRDETPSVADATTSSTPDNDSTPSVDINPDASTFGADDSTPELNNDDSSGVGEDDYTIDDLLNSDFSDYEEFTGETNHTGLKPLQEVMKHMVPEGRKHIANLRAMTTRKTQEVADLKRQLESEREQLNAEREALYNGDFAKKVTELAADPETPHDLFDEEGMAAKIQQEAARMFQEMIQPLQKEMAVKEQKAKLRAFEAENPLMTDPSIKMKVFEMLKARPELKPQDAFYIIKAQHDSASIAEAEAARKEVKDARRSALRRTSVGSTNTANGTPKFKNAWEAYTYHRDNPSR